MSSIYPESKYKFVKFRRSKTTHKKYDAILMNKDTGKQKIIPFGDNRYQQYRDSVPLKLYSNLDHGDINRRNNYRKRHKNEGDNNRKYSAGWFSWHFLW